MTEGYRQKEYGQAVKRYCQTLDLKDDPELIAKYKEAHSRYLFLDYKRTDKIWLKYTK